MALMNEGEVVVWWLSIYYSVLSIQQKQYIVSAMFVIVIISKDIVTLLSHPMSFASSCGNHSSVTIKPSHLISSLYRVPLPSPFFFFRIIHSKFQVRTNPHFTRTLLSNQMCFKNPCYGFIQQRRFITLCNIDTFPKFSKFHDSPHTTNIVSKNRHRFLQS